MSAYFIARIDVSNPDKYVKYASKTLGIVEKFGGRFLVKAGAFEQVEGGGPDRHVVIEFPDRETARAFYDCAEYREILPVALANSTRDVVIVDGV